MNDGLMRAESLLRVEIEWTERGRRGGERNGMMDMFRTLMDMGTDELGRLRSRLRKKHT